MILQKAIRVTKAEICISFLGYVGLLGLTQKTHTNSTSRANLIPTLCSMLNTLCRIKLHLLIGFSCSLRVLILLSWNLFTNGQSNGIDPNKTCHF